MTKFATRNSQYDAAQYHIIAFDRTMTNVKHIESQKSKSHIDGLEEDCSNSSVLSHWYVILHTKDK